MKTPTLQYAFSIKIKLKLPSIRIDSNVAGPSRVSVYIEEGIIEGPMLQGNVLPMSGGDWAMVRADGVIDFDARYLLKTHDGTIIYMTNRGYRWGTEKAMAAQARQEEVPFEEYYMRVTPKFEVEKGPYDWMAKHVFVGVAEKIPQGNVIHYHIVR